MLSRPFGEKAKHHRNRPVTRNPIEIGEVACYLAEMSPHLSDAFRRDFPHLTADYGGDPATTSMSAGFAIADGWEPLFRRLLTEIETIRLALPPAEAAKVKLLQVKEKWGGLRVYVDTENDAIQQALDQAEQESFGVCEKCGATGEDVFPQGGGWVRTLCSSCRGEPKGLR